MKTNKILSTMKVVSWVIFIGICIKAGAMVISSFVSLFVNQGATKDLYLGLNLSTLYEFGVGHYVMLLALIISLLVLQAYIFFLVIKLFTKFDEHSPFNKELSKLILKISYFSLFTGLIASIGTGYSKWLGIKNILIPFDWGAEEFLFMAGVIFIVALFYKRGIEIQLENELTV
ncbi:DUF2975 domain-containing protein [Salinimicrobium oceani]|uniref:DUF2975 domain-containing protein n=1 Tax=Salinimicrobium oceani TaxID=2722702 RepID=A0ABX1CZE6_9FLAO|nr:DUF2975 domain-containing protein [Salinimicrobium oceani]NJW53643.1 DUF2975 domain-containing protein [Salinimicrobium oceani]